jgi:hypothetical protein
MGGEMSKDDYKFMLQWMEMESRFNGATFHPDIVRMVYRKAGIPLPKYLIPKGIHVLVHKPCAVDYLKPYMDKAIKFRQDKWSPKFDTEVIQRSITRVIRGMGL